MSLLRVDGNGCRDAMLSRAKHRSMQQKELRQAAALLVQLGLGPGDYLVAIESGDPDVPGGYFPSHQVMPYLYLLSLSPGF